MIYDTAVNRFVSNSGYLSLELPSRGSVARWESTWQDILDGDRKNSYCFGQDTKLES